MIQTKNSLVGKLNNAIEKVYPELENLEVTPTTSEQNFKSNKYGYNEVKVNPIEGDTLEVTPSLEQQSFEGVFSKVDINPIEGDKLEVIPNKENQQFNGVYDDVTVKPIPDEYITPEGTVNISENGNVDVSKYANANVQVKTSAVQSKGVDFVDYDGTLLYSYTLEEIQGLTELPELPISKGLICQEWNWTLEDIKEFGKELTVGATYITDDGKTRLYIHIETEEIMNVPICFRQTVSNGVEVDWGDESPIETFEGSGTTDILPTHQYSKAGDYVITLNPINCTLTLGTNNNQYNIMGKATNTTLVYQNMLTKVEIGKNVTTIGESTFSDCFSLTEIAIPKGITSVGQEAFRLCYLLTGITIPNGVTSIGNYTFADCHSLTEIAIPNSITSTGNYVFKNCSLLTKIFFPVGGTSSGSEMFAYCHSLKEIVIPNSITSINSNIFQSCYSLTELVIPDSVKSIQNNIAESCYKLKKITIPSSVTSIGTSAFASCYSLSEITIPSSVTSIGTSAFTSCYSLKEITIPDGVKSIASSVFSYCRSLTKIVIPSSVTSIGTSAFSSCSAMTKYDFSEHTQVPTLSNTNVFTSIPTDCKIIVPDDLYDEWIVATNWSTYASKIVKASEV